MAKVTHVAVTNGTAGKGVLLAQNTSSSETHEYLIHNTDAALAIEILGQNDDESQQVFGAGYTFAAGVQVGLDLGPGETLWAAAAPGDTVVVHVLDVRSVDSGG